MFVSIVIPTYNSENTIKQTLNSVKNLKNKRFVDIYCVVIDDKSKDKTNLIIQDYIDKEVVDVFIENKKAELEHRLKVEEVIDFLDLQHYRDTIISGLPYGVRKNVELARALCTNPKLLLLDEPSSGLDRAETAALAATLAEIQREKGFAVLLVEHDVELVAAFTDRTYVLDFGRLIANGPTEQMMADAEVRRAYLGDLEVGR